MKKIIIYSLMALALAVPFTACDNDYEDSTSVHVYGPNENPPVKADPALTATNIFEMTGGQTDPVTIELDNYAEMIQNAFGLSVDELMSKLGGEYLVAPINPNRMVWLKTAPNSGDAYGWCVSKTGNVCQNDDENLYGKLVFNKEARRFEFFIDPNAGGTVQMQIGFVKDDGINYNTAVRFVLSVTAYDKSFVFRDVTIPPGDYVPANINLADLAENINFVFGMTPEDLAAAINDESVKMYMIDPETNSPVWDGTSTANAGGYWVNPDGVITGYGDNSAYYIEPHMGDDEGDMIAIGFMPGYASDVVYNIRFVLADAAEHSKIMTFIINASPQ